MIRSESMHTVKLLNLGGFQKVGLFTFPAASSSPSLSNEGPFQLTRGPLVETECLFMSRGNGQDEQTKKAREKSNVSQCAMTKSIFVYKDIIMDVCVV